VYIALTLLALGAKEDARSYYDDVLSKAVVVTSSYAHVGNLKGDDTIIYSALVAALLAGLEDPRAGLFATYVASHTPKETLINFQKLLYYKELLPRLPQEESSFVYKMHDKEQEVVLRPGEVFTKTLTANDLATFSIVSKKGSLGLVTTYEEGADSTSVVQDKNISLSRSYEVGGVETHQFNEGDLVLVRLRPWFTINALSGAYQIIDRLPSGLRPVDQESVRYYSSYDTRVYPTEINDQTVTFVVDKGVTLSVYYYARVVSKGTYKAEPALLQSLSAPESQSLSHEETIRIK
jgi:uncharacterized protein YfaS (alpha-2-macroglobulin family)